MLHAPRRTPDASAVPATMGTSAAYVALASRLRSSAAAKSAVNAGSVAETAWLKETGMKRSETLPATTEAQKTAESRATRRVWRALRSGSYGTSRRPRTAAELRAVHAAICARGRGGRSVRRGRSGRGGGGRTCNAVRNTG